MTGVLDRTFDSTWQLARTDEPNEATIYSFDFAIDQLGGGADSANRGQESQVWRKRAKRGYPVISCRFRKRTQPNKQANRNQPSSQAPGQSFMPAIREIAIRF